MFRIPGDRLAQWNRWQRFIPGERLESEEAAVCRIALETIPLCSSLQERILCSGTTRDTVLHPPCRNFRMIIGGSWDTSDVYNFNPCHSFKSSRCCFSDCSSSRLCVYCPGVQFDCPSVWKVPQSASGSQHVWRTVYLHQVRRAFIHQFSVIIVKTKTTKHVSAPFSDIIEVNTKLIFKPLILKSSFLLGGNKNKNNNSHI